MTYCLAIAVNEGLVFASDSRTNAGIDYVTSYSKMHVCQPADDRLFVILSAGNLATTQDVLNRLQRDLEASDGRQSLANVQYPFEAAHYLGHLSRQAQGEHLTALSGSGVDATTTLILGGQIRGHMPQIFLIYPQGNHISASPETPYLQIGENKYGKPMLDRIGLPTLPLTDAARLALVSLDATVRSNLTVGHPLEVAIYPTDSFNISWRETFREDSPYFQSLTASWQQGLQSAFNNLPSFDWEQT